MQGQFVQTKSANPLDDRLVILRELFPGAFIGTGKSNGVHLQKMPTRAIRLPYYSAALCDEHVRSLARECRTRTT